MKKILLIFGIVLVYTGLIGIPVSAESEESKLIADDGAAYDFFGHSVSISENTLVAGSPYDCDNGPVSGSVYVFARNDDDSWSQQAKLTASDGAARDGFGYSVSISGNTLVVGSFNDDDNGLSSGSAYVFIRNDDDSWSQQAKLIPSDGAEDDLFGLSVAISENTIVVGAFGDDDNDSDSGSAYVFARNDDDSWSQQAKLTASDGAARDGFGYSVSISGNTLVVGSFNDDDNGLSSGSAYVFIRNDDDSWSQQAKLTAGDGAARDYFGWSVSISENTIVVGAFGDDDNDTESGSAYVFIRSDGDSWSQQAKLIPSDGSVLDHFGQQIAISGNTVLANAPYDDDNGINSGSVYAFMRNDDNSWSQQAKFTAGDIEGYNGYGNSVSVCNDTVVVGANHDHDNGVSSGAVYVYQVLMNNPPVANAGSDQIVEQETHLGAEIILNGINSSDSDDDPLFFLWSANGITFDDSTSSTPSAIFPSGTTTVTLVVNDGTVDSEPDYVDITVEDTTAPVISLVVTPDILWPPNHKMVKVSTVSATDTCDTNPTVAISVTHNESTHNNKGVGDGNTGPDWEIQADSSILLRAERVGTNTDRIYTITVIATDNSGNESTATATVTVPHDQGE
ncbi:hypothetical protein ACFLUJ_04870 [Chloroflexota bacterium]